MSPIRAQYYNSVKRRAETPYLYTRIDCTDSSIKRNLQLPFAK